MKVREVMTRNVIFAPPAMSIAEAAELMADHGFTALPVIDEDDQLIGIVTEADLLRNRVPSDPRLSGFNGLRLPRRTVADVMTTSVESVTPGADIQDAASIMLEDRIRCLPVVDGHGVVGILSRRDLVKSAIAKDDATIAQEIQRRLRPYGEPYRWSVAVQAGVVEIDDYRDDAADRAEITHLVRSVPGVVSVRVHHQTPDPF